MRKDEKYEVKKSGGVSPGDRYGCDGFAGCGKGNTGEGETKGADREKALDLRTLTQDMKLRRAQKRGAGVSSVVECRMSGRTGISAGPPSLKNMDWSTMMWI